MIIQVLQNGSSTVFEVEANYVRGVVPPQFRHLTSEFTPWTTKEQFLSAAIAGRRNIRDLRVTGNGLRVLGQLPGIENPEPLLYSDTLFVIGDELVSSVTN